MTTTAIPAGFRQVWRQVVTTVQPRYLEPTAMLDYWAVLGDLPLRALEACVPALVRGRSYLPTAAEWADAAGAVLASDAPSDSVRRLEELDAWPPWSPARDAVCKGLSSEDGDALMARYGYVRVGRGWRHAREGAVR